MAGLNPNNPPTTFAAILSDAKKITALGNGTYGIDFPGDCQGGLGFVMEPNLWAVNDNLIQGPIGSQTINIVHNGPLAQLLLLYRNLWNEGLAPANAHTDNCSTWTANFAADKIGLLPGAYGFYPTWVTDKIIGHVGIAPLPGPKGGYSTFDGGDDFVIPSGAKNAFRGLGVRTVGVAAGSARAVPVARVHAGAYRHPQRGVHQGQPV